MKRHRRHTFEWCRQQWCGLVTSTFQILVPVRDRPNVEFTRLAQRRCLHMGGEDFHQQGRL